MAADNQVVIVGSANFDEQSWYNSRELNLIIDDHKTAKKLCEKVFLTDYLRGQVMGSKLWAGEKCWRNSQCRIGVCNNHIGNSWRCIFKTGTGLPGAYCDHSKQCKSRTCYKQANKCY